MNTCETTRCNLVFRQRVLVNTDPQRRCYNGCHARSELQWTSWDVLEYQIPVERAKDRIKFWVELNDYAVSCRGEGAKSEFKIEEEFSK